MKYLIAIALLAFVLSACNNKSDSADHDHDHDALHNHDAHEGHDHGSESHNHAEHDGHDHSGHEGHDHGEEAEEACDHDHGEEAHDHDAHAGHDHGAVKVLFTGYSDTYEVFAEADPLTVGKTSNFLAHFSNIANFSPLDKGSVTAMLLIDGEETRQTLDHATKKGIYNFNLTPETAGKGLLIFNIKTETSSSNVMVSNIEVFKDEHDAIHAAESVVLPSVNTIGFTKEQSWRVDFATEQVQEEAFGQVIKTTAQIQSAQGDEVYLTAKASGVVLLSKKSVLEGQAVSKGQVLFSISGTGLSEDNSTVQFVEAKNDFDKADADYNRLLELSKEKIVSEKELLNAKNTYDNAKIHFENLSKDFNANGQKVSSSMSGYITQVFVQNGQYVEAGQTVLRVSQNKTMQVNADVQQKYAPILGTIHSANIRTIYNDRTYALEELNGQVLSYGRNTNTDNYLVPISLQIDNNGDFVSGGFVELFLKTMTNSKALTIPNSALLEEQGNFFVFVQATPELFEKREVKKGATDGIRTEILNGLSKDDRVVSKGAVLVKLSEASGALDPHAGHVH